MYIVYTTRIYSLGLEGYTGYKDTLTDTLSLEMVVYDANLRQNFSFV